MAESNGGRFRGLGQARRSPCSQSESSCSSGERSFSTDEDNDSDEEEILGAALRGCGGYPEPQKTIQHTVTGTPVSVLANYFKLLVPDDSYIYQYHVTFEPNVESTGMRRILFREHRNLFHNAYIFDGSSNTKSLTRLDENETVVTSLRTTDGQRIEITIKYTGMINYDSLEMMRLYNTQMRRNLHHLQYVSLGRHYFAPGNRTQIKPHNLEIWEGMLTAINQHDGGILMVCDTIFKVMRTDTVRDTLLDIIKRNPNSIRDAVRRELSGRIVMTSYNNKLYKIDDIDFNNNPTYTFKRRNDEISIIDYYREQYNIEIRDQTQPLIQCLPNERQNRSGITEPILLVPELCVMTGMSESLSKNFKLKQEMAKFTRATPETRVAKLTEFNRNLQANDNVRQEMAEWNINFDPNLVKLTARVLPCEKLNNSITFKQETGDFSKEIREKSMPAPVQFTDWSVIVAPKERNIVDEFVLTLKRVCEPLGVKVQRPVIKILEDGAIRSFVNACKGIPKTCIIVVIIVPNNNEDRYDAIKRVLCIENPILSQVVVSRTISNKQMLMSICTKIGIQMAVKIGAEPWILEIPPKSLMVVGYSTYHDITRRKESVGGFVCSLNANLSRYFSRTSYHKNREEMSNNFAANLELGLQKYYNHNGAYPLKVVVYRDGVSEGQIPYVNKTELKKMKDAIRKIDPNRKIKLTFIIVTKRVNARFFLHDQRSTFRNPYPGTIIDTVVTRKQRYDFYMVSHSVRQGTVSPTMYNIIADEINWKPHRHHQLAYKLCHLYYNWMGTISVPAPCQYAHKLAYLTGTSLHREANARLCESLYFL